MDEYLKAQMASRGWNVPRLAEACDVSVGLAAKWVSDNPRYRVRPNPLSCAKIAAALDVDPDEVLALAGHRPRPTAAMPSDPVQSELDARLARLSRVLRHYPRAFWLAVIEASERMADAGQLLEGRVNGPSQGGVNAPHGPQNWPDDGPPRGLTATSSPRHSRLTVALAAR